MMVSRQTGYSLADPTNYARMLYRVIGSSWQSLVIKYTPMFFHFYTRKYYWAMEAGTK